MAQFQELVEKYKKRSRDELVDQVSVGLTYAESVTKDLGVLTDSGLIKDTLSSIGTVLPFAVIAVTEEMKVIFGKKDQKTMFKDTAARMAKSGAALTAGAAAAAVAGPVGGLSAAIGTRVFLDHYKSKSLTAVRLRSRTERLRSLRKLNVKRLELTPAEDGCLYE